MTLAPLRLRLVRGIGLLLAALAMAWCAQPVHAQGDVPALERPARVFCVVHCDPVPPTGFAANFKLLEELVAAADQAGMLLSIHWTGSYADLALRAGKSSIIQGWIAKGHGMGAHVHPEEANEQGNWPPQVDWKAFPQDRVDEAVSDATEVVNRLVGKERNRALDTLFPFFTSPARFHEQYTHFAWGNNGHGRPAPIVLEQGRRLTAVFYRTLPGDPSVDAFHFPATRLMQELRALTRVGSCYGPVLHPADFQGATRRELIEFFRLARAAGYRPARVEDMAAERGEDADLRLSVLPRMAADDGRRVEIRVENQGDREISDLTLTVHLPADYPKLAEAGATPAPTAQDDERGLLEFALERLEAGETQRFDLPLAAAGKPVGHPISGVLDAYLEGEGLTSLWSLATLAGSPEAGYFLPFESYNPEGQVRCPVQRRAAGGSPRLDAAAAESLRREILARPTKASNVRERLGLAVALARQLLEGGRQAELDRALPAQVFQRLERQVREGRRLDAAARELDAILLRLIDLVVATSDRPPAPGGRGGKRPLRWAGINYRVILDK